MFGILMKMPMCLGSIKMLHIVLPTFGASFSLKGLRPVERSLLHIEKHSHWCIPL